MPKELRDKKELQDEKGAVQGEEGDAVAYTPPDPLWPSGILSVIVHQIVSLELEDVYGSEGGKRKGGREFEPARDAGEIKEEASKKVPSAYCTMLLNDELVSYCWDKCSGNWRMFFILTERLDLQNSNQGRVFQADFQRRY